MGYILIILIWQKMDALRADAESTVKFAGKIFCILMQNTHLGEAGSTTKS